MPDRRLVVLIEGNVAGRVDQDDRGRLQFAYDDAWRGDTSRTPLSLSMPLAASTYPDEVIRPFLWGLLPDNERVLERWARENQVSAGNPFALLTAVGEDCPGAVQLAPPERIDALLRGEGGVDWLDERQIAESLRQLRADPSAWHVVESGQFSLGGAQSKTALLHDPATGAWGAPRGARPTTHILKPAVTGLDEHDLNEHLCLLVARRLGLPAARTQVLSFGGERVIVVERYDRRPAEDGIRRVHQEDLCQALGVLPGRKYQNDGGPSPADIVGLLRANVRPWREAEAAVATFVDALALNWVLAGTDAHAKNYSLLLAGSGVRLAPLYDIASMLPYGEHLPKLKLAMKIGGEYRLGLIAERHWRRLADELGLDADGVVERVVGIVERVPGVMADVAGSAEVRAVGSSLPQGLVDRVGEWAAACRASLG